MRPAIDMRDEIMRLARELAEIQAEHAIARHEFGHGRAEYAPIPKLAKAWQMKHKELFSAIEKSVS